MTLLTPDDRKQLPPLYTQEHAADPIVYVKFILMPGPVWTWYATEFDPRGRFFGWVDGLDEKWGYFLLEELEQELTDPRGLRVMRDGYFIPKPLSIARRPLTLAVEQKFVWVQQERPPAIWQEWVHTRPTCQEYVKNLETFYRDELKGWLCRVALLGTIGQEG